MPKFYFLVILLINQSKEIGEQQFSVFGSKGGQISLLMQASIPLSTSFQFLFKKNKVWNFMRIVCQQTILVKYHVLIVILEKNTTIWNCRLLQILRGAHHVLVR